MTVQSGFVKHKRYHTNDDYTKSAISEWTREETVEMNDGTRTLNDIMDAENNKFNYGDGTIAGGNNQVVTGKYNIEDQHDEYARITGGGSADNNRRNIETLDWNGNVKFAGTITTGNNINLNDVLLLTHPVGSYYWSSNPTNPHDLFGGTWARVTNKFIYAVGDNQQVGVTGGSELTGFTFNGTTNPHNISVSELPPHAHTYDKATGVGDHTLTLDEIPSHAHSLGNNASGLAQAAGEHRHDSKFPQPVEAYDTEGQRPIEIIATDIYGTDQKTSYDGEHTHTVQLSGSTEVNGGGLAHNHPLSTTPDTSTSSVGGGEGHTHDFTVNPNNIPNMPPFETAYCWKRTA